VDGKRCEHFQGVKYVDELLSMFFGYPGGGHWRGIMGKNPFHFRSLILFMQLRSRIEPMPSPTETHFKLETTLWASMQKVGEEFIDDLIEGENLRPCCSIGRADSLETLEKAITPFVDCIWSSSRDKTTGKRDQLWY
jgi:hypothetical protein